MQCPTDGDFCEPCLQRSLCESPEIDVRDSRREDYRNDDKRTGPDQFHQTLIGTRICAPPSNQTARTAFRDEPAIPYRPAIPSKHPSLRVPQRTKNAVFPNPKSSNPQNTRTHWANLILTLRDNLS